MTHAAIIQRTLELAATLDIETTDILALAQKSLDVTFLGLDNEGEPPRHILGLCKDASMFLINIRPDETDPARETWDIYSFRDPDLFERFLHDPAGEASIPPAIHKGLLESYNRFHLISSLEPGHA